MADPGLLAIGVLAVALAYLNGLHDASNAVSTTIATRALSERTALALAAALNLLGALLALGLADADAGLAHGALQGVLDNALPLGELRLVLASALVAALVWGMLTWWWGMPSSTWHAMLGGIAGGSLLIGPPTGLGAGMQEVVLSLLLSPLAGGLLTYALAHGISRLSRRRRLRTRHLRAAQTLSASAVAVGHGLHDSVLPMTAIVLAIGGVSATREGADLGGSGLPWWAGLLVAVALALGTLAGGHRIIRTLATRLTDLSTPQGLAAETSAAVVLYMATAVIGAPVSTSHTVTAGIVGSGLAVGPRSVRWPVVGRALLTWILTPLVTAAIAALAAAALSTLL